MPSRTVEYPGQNLKGWKGRQESAKARTAAHHAGLALSAKRASLHRRDAARDAFNAAVDSRNKLAARVSSLGSTLATMEARSLQSGRPESGMMKVTFDLSAARKFLIVAEADVVTTQTAAKKAQEAFEQDVARQNAEAEAAEQDDVEPEPVVEPVKAAKATTKGKRP